MPKREPATERVEFKVKRQFELFAEKSGMDMGDLIELTLKQAPAIAIAAKSEN